MPDPGKTLVDLGTLLGLLSDPDGNFEFSWFASPGPEQNSLEAIYTHPEHLGTLVKDLTPASDIKPLLNGTGSASFFNAGRVEVGLAWTEPQDNCTKIGIAATLSKEELGKLVASGWLIKILNGQTYQLASDLGDAEIKGTLELSKPPDKPLIRFLDSITVNVAFPNPEQSNDTSLTITGTQPDTTVVKTFKLKGAQPVWDPIRAAIFVLDQWVRYQAAQPGADPQGFFVRVSRHLLPMLGDQIEPLNPIQPLQPFQPPGADPGSGFTTWVDSINPAKNTNGALRFLWHLRALTTGNEDPRLFSGSSVFIPLDIPQYVPAYASGALPEPPTFPPNVPPQPPQLDSDGNYLGLINATNVGEINCVLREVLGKQPTDIALFQFAPTGLQKPASINLPEPGGEAICYKDQKKRSVFTYKDQKLTITSDCEGIAIDFDFDAHALTIVLNPPGGPEIIMTVGEKVSPTLKVGDLNVGGDAPPSELFAILQLFEQEPLNPPKADERTQWLYALGRITGNSSDPGDFFNSLVPGLSKPGVVLGNHPTQITLTPSFNRPGITLGAKLSGSPYADLANGICVDEVDATVTWEKNFSGSVTFKNLRLNKADAGASVIEWLLPDLKLIRGFDVVVSSSSSPPLALDGSAQIPIERQLGPLEIQSLSVDAQRDSLGIGFDASFSFAGINVSTDELGLTWDYGKRAATPSLRGLGLSGDFGPVSLGGMFGRVNGDYVGAAKASVFSTFELDAIGGYEKLDNGNTSVFIFASIRAPLGGPPFCFVTGLAGGFGLNRLLPPINNVDDNPFMQVMRGQFDFADVGGSLAQLDKQFDVVNDPPGDFWIAAGLTFTSFAFINGRLLAAIKFNPFALQIMGSAGFTIPPHLANFEIDFSCSVDDQHFLVQAGLSRNCYVLDPGVFGLQGQFALGVWYAGPYAGDFVLTIGGYHPCFTPLPPNYPNVDRVAVNANIDPAHLSISCFFACTPHAIMSGASVSLWADFGDIKAGLDLWVDVFIRWDPFYLYAELGIDIWFEFWGRHEIGVNLKVWTPTFGGTAHVSILIISFDAPFGKGNCTPPPPHISDFLANHLQLPSKEPNPPPDGPVPVAAFSSAQITGLMRLDIGFGRVTKQSSAKQDDGQEGTSGGPPIAVNPEFGLVLRTRLPVLGNAQPVGDPPYDDPDSSHPDRGSYQIVDYTVSGSLHLPLCREGTFEGCSLTITVPVPNDPKHPFKPDNAPKGSGRNYPAAQFGEEVPNIQASAGEQAGVAQVMGQPTTVYGQDTITVDYSIKPSPSEDTKWEIEVDEAIGTQVVYPLELPQWDWKGPIPPLTKDFFKQRGLRGWKGTFASLQPVATSAPVVKPLEQLTIRDGVVPTARAHRRNVAFRAGPIARTLDNGTPLVAVPAMQPRRSELTAMVLRVERRPLAGSGPPGSFGSGRLSLVRTPTITAQSRSQPPDNPLAVKPGQALHVELAQMGSARGTIEFTVEPGTVVRAIFLGAYARVTGDVQVRATTKFVLPPATRRLVLIGEAADVPLFGPREDRPQEPMGVERYTLVTALEGRAFAAHGCVVRVEAGVLPRVPSFTAVPGRELLRVANQLRLDFSTALKGMVAIIARAIVPGAPEIAEQIRWSAVGAVLGAQQTVSVGTTTAVLLAVNADNPWSLVVSAEAAYRIEGVTAAACDPATGATALGLSADWTFLDHTFDPADAALPSAGEAASARLELQA
jgi:hypothetical protein